MHTNEARPLRVSVIIPTLNAGEEFQELLGRLNRQTLKPYEIIVIDSESADGTVERAQAAGARTMTVRRTEFDHGGTRNRAAAEAVGDILAFMTQDALPADDRLIEKLVQPLTNSEGGIAMSYARQLPRDDASLTEQLARAHNYPADSRIQSVEQLDEQGIKTFFCSNVCAAIRRDVFEEMGRFHEPVIFNEDMFMAAKCVLNGYQIAYRGDAQVIHSHNYSVMQQFKRFFDNGVSMRLNAWIMPYSAVGGAGSKLVWNQLKGLAARGGWRHMPKLIADSAAKLLGFKLGLHHRRLPKGIIKRISMHPLIWGALEAKSEGNAAASPLPRRQSGSRTMDQ